MTTFDFTDQFVIVTGAAGSLGSTVAEQFRPPWMAEVQKTQELFSAKTFFRLITQFK